MVSFFVCLQPNIITMLDSKILSNATCIILEYMHGRDLCDRVVDDATAEKYGLNDGNVVRFLFFQICSGVEYLHNQRFVHRDLKVNFFF